MGGRGGSAFKKGSPDGVFMTNETQTFTTQYYRAEGWNAARYNDEIVEAKTDGYGNVTFGVPENRDFADVSKRRADVTITMQAGAVNGKTFNIDWSKVNSVKGNTFSVRQEAKNAGLKWDAQSKIWKRQ